MNPPRVEPLEFLQIEDAPITQVPLRKPKPFRAPMSEEMAAWVARKRRERDRLPLRQCDREQLVRQLEDQGAL